MVPKSELSRAIGLAASIPVPRFLRGAIIGGFAKAYGADIDEAERPLTDYRSVQDFFTRKLKPGARPVDVSPSAIVSPVDGTVSEFGEIDNGRLIQAKGRRYHVASLLENDEWAQRFIGGFFVTIYLAPNNYHRIHSAVDGRLVAWQHLPGTLYPVFSAAVEHVPSLFVVNERVTSYLETKSGGHALVKVGALGVGNITLTYTPLATNKGEQAGRLVQVSNPRAFQRGEELGAFNFGSTVILLFEKGAAQLDGLATGRIVRMGERLGQLTPAAPIGPTPDDAPTP